MKNIVTTHLNHFCILSNITEFANICTNWREPVNIAAGVIVVSHIFIKLKLYLNLKKNSKEPIHSTVVTKIEIIQKKRISHLFKLNKMAQPNSSSMESGVGVEEDNQYASNQAQPRSCV